MSGRDLRPYDRTGQLWDVGLGWSAVQRKTALVVGPPVNIGRLTARRYHPCVDLETGTTWKLEESDFDRPWEHDDRRERIA